MAREVIDLDDDDAHHHRASRLTPSASPPPRWRPRVGGVFLGRREEQSGGGGGGVDHHDEGRVVADAGGTNLGGASLPATPRPHPDAIRRLPFVTRHPKQLGGGVDHHDERSAVADAVGIHFGGASLVPTTPRPHRDVVRRLPFGTRHPQQLGGVDHQYERSHHFVTPHLQRAVAKAPDVVVVIDDDDDHRLTPSLEHGGVGVDQHNECCTIAASPPPNWQQSVGGMGRFSLPTFDGSRPSFLTPPPAKKSDTFGVQQSRRALFFTPPARSGPIFKDPFEVCDDEDEDEEDVSTLPPPKRRSLFGKGDADSTPTKLPSCNAFSLVGEGDADSTPTKLVSCNAGSRSSSYMQGGSRRGRGAGRATGRSGPRVQVGPAGRGSRAQALAELLGDNGHKLRPDNGPAPGQDLKEWQSQRNRDLIEEYEYLDGLLTRIYKLPQGRRVTALARKGWVEFYSRLEVCLVVRKQMREAKAYPTPVPDRLMDEVR